MFINTICLQDIFDRNSFFVLWFDIHRVYSSIHHDTSIVEKHFLLVRYGRNIGIRHFVYPVFYIFFAVSGYWERIRKYACFHHMAVHYFDALHAKGLCEITIYRRGVVICNDECSSPALSLSVFGCVDDTPFHRITIFI